MNTFFFFGDYTRDALDGIDARRTRIAEETITGYGGRLKSVYALLGDHDIVMIAELPGVPEALQVSVTMSRQTGISFTSCPALPVADFDRLASGALHEG